MGGEQGDKGDKGDKTSFRSKKRKYLQNVAKYYERMLKKEESK